MRQEQSWNLTEGWRPLVFDDRRWRCELLSDRWGLGRCRESRTEEGTSFLGRRSHGWSEGQGRRISLLGKVRVWGGGGEREMNIWGPGIDCRLGRGSSGLGRITLGSEPGGVDYCGV